MLSPFVIYLEVRGLHQKYRSVVFAGEITIDSAGKRFVPLETWIRFCVYFSRMIDIVHTIFHNALFPPGVGPVHGCTHHPTNVPDVAVAGAGGDHPAHRHHRTSGQSLQEQELIPYSTKPDAPWLAKFTLCGVSPSLWAPAQVRGALCVVRDNIRVGPVAFKWTADDSILSTKNHSPGGKR